MSTVKVKLCDAQHKCFKEGRVSYNKIADAANIEYNGRTYGYQVTSEVAVAKFVEVGPPVVLMDKDFE